MAARLAGVPSPITVRVPAKINLALSVGPLRPDGFHELSTVYHAISLYDDVTATPADGISVEVTGDESAGVPADETNLAFRAAALLASHTGVSMGVHLDIVKGIPVAGGMAGGSADAAATLVACDALWGTELDRDELSHLAARLGSDVPFLLAGGTALGIGRGESVTPVLSRGSFHWVVALAEGGLSTPAVYAEFDRLGDPSAAGVDRVMSALRVGDAVELGRSLSNDLQPAALSLRPSLHRVLEAADEMGALGALVSGSGPTVVMLARDADHALSMEAALPGHGVCRAARRAQGPVGGARVVDAR